MILADWETRPKPARLRGQRRGKRPFTVPPA
jgi:hypothetical protein